ncbi:hypothetical protein [Asticcacaulis sp.]|uniref:hypothetical protein n=1 Tax=Asticcacaulis sp. TaxID=1872648 RepID=UPI0026209A10|nr:hypothetical protein [Asticcacaulis sp.]
MSEPDNQAAPTGEVPEMRVPKPPLLPEVAEYVEKTILDGLKRELDQEENVVRSLPFFATSMAALLALLGLTREPISKAEPGLLLWVILGLVGLIGVALVAIIILMFLATKRQSQDLLMPEKDLIAHARRLEETYNDIAEDKRRAEAVRASVRRDITEQLAAYAQELRGINVYRLALRARMFSLLTAAVVCATLLISAIIFLEREERTRDEQRKGVSSEVVGTSEATAGELERQVPDPDGRSPGTCVPAEGTSSSGTVDTGNQPLGCKDIPGQTLTPAPEGATLPTQGHSDPEGRP